MATKKKSHRNLKICIAITLFLLILIAVVLIILYFTMFKPKEPKMIAQPITLESFNGEISVVAVLLLNVSLGVTVTIDNPNYGSFKFTNGTAYVDYRGDVVAEAAIGDDTIPARKKHNVSTTAIVQVDKLMANPYFLTDSLAGVLNITTSTTLHGKVTVLKIFKLKAVSYGTCDISIYIFEQNADSACKSVVKLQ